MIHCDVSAPGLAWRQRQTPALQLLLACLRCTTNPAAPAALPPSALTDAAWAALPRLVTRHRVPALAWRGLQLLPLDAVPAGVRQTLERGYRRNVERSLAQTRDLLLLLRRFADSDVPVLPLKGAILSQRLYGDPGLRHSNDIDLLVAPRSLVDADALLVAAGYVREHPRFGVDDRRWPLFERLCKDACYRKPGASPVELHWRLHAMASFHPATLEDLLATADWVKLGGTALPVTNAVEQLLYLAGHGARHAWFRLSWLCDIPPLLADMDLQQQRAASRRAQELGLLRPLAQALVLSQQVFGTPIPHGLATTASRNPAVHDLVASAQAALVTVDPEDLKPDSVVESLHAFRRMLRLKPHIAYKIECLRRRMFSVRDIMVLSLPPALSFIYILLRPWYWAKRRWAVQSPGANSNRIRWWSAARARSRPTWAKGRRR